MIAIAGYWMVRDAAVHEAYLGRAVDVGLPGTGFLGPGGFQHAKLFLIVLRRKADMINTRTLLFPVRHAGAETRGGQSVREEGEEILGTRVKGLRFVSAIGNGG